MALRLWYNDKSIVLPAGQLFIGRSPDCHIVSTDPQASRRHAVISMGRSGAFVTDLGSRAGVRVNDELITGARRLARGDVIQIAAMSMTVEDATVDTDDEPTDPRLRATISPPSAGAEPASLHLRPPPLGVAPVEPRQAFDTLLDEHGDDDDSDDGTLSHTQEAPRSRSHEASLSRTQEGPMSQLSRTQEGPMSQLSRTQEALRVAAPDPVTRPGPPSSRRAGDLSATRIPRLAPPPTFPREGTLRALAAVGEKAIALGRAEEAERILTRALHEALDGVRRGELDASTAELAATLAARLAGATGAGRWFDHAVAVYVARAELAPAQVVDQLYAAVGKTRMVDKAMFREYLATVKSASGDSPARRFVIQRLEGLQRILDLK